MQRLQQTRAVLLRDSVANHQIPVPINVCLHSLHPSVQVTTKEWEQLQCSIYFSFDAYVSN
jgi:hypothetical protein